MVVENQLLVPPYHVDGCWRVVGCDCVADALSGAMVVVLAGCAIAVAVGRRQQVMNSAAEQTSNVVGVCARGCPYSFEGPLRLATALVEPG